jgi:hypothetical protein
MDDFPKLLDNLLTVQIKTLHRMLLAVRDGCVDSIEANTKVHSPDRRSITVDFQISAQLADLYKLDVADSTGYSFRAILSRPELSSAIDACAEY